MRPQLTRREVVLAGGLGVVGGLAAGLPGQAAAAPPVAGPPGGDLRVLGDLLRTEQLLEYAYRRVLRSWKFAPSTQGVLRLALGHEVEHAAVLEEHRKALAGGGTPATQGTGPTGSSGS
ncbi:MAG TPA: hypothetical protein VE983_07050, partial [Solirubrobacteraceae bacterium]|nr:hypothetical protein [Solirubrobacteraceae bacterium]